MKITVTAIIFFIVSFNIQSVVQAQPYTKNINSTKKYYSLVNNAELKILDSNYYTAIRKYKKAFYYSKQPFYKDLYNCMLLAIMINKSESMVNYFLNKKISIPGYLITDSSTTYYKEYQKFAKIADKVPEYIKRDSTYILLLSDLIQQDQSYRLRMMDKNEGCYNVVGRDTLPYVDSIVTNTLLKKIYETGIFPSEQRLGYHYCYTFLTVIFSHCQAWTGYAPFDSICKNSIFSCEFHPQLYANLFDKRIDNDTANRQPTYYGTSSLAIINDSLHYQNYTPFEKLEIDKNRKKIFLDSYDDFVRKARFQQKHPMFMLIYSDLLPVFVFD